MSSLCTTISPSIVTTGAGGRFVVVVRARKREMISAGWQRTHAVGFAIQSGG